MKNKSVANIRQFSRVVKRMISPTPWKVNAKSFIWAESIGCHIFQKSVQFHDEEQAEANAAFIVRAVNSHNDLLEIAKDTLCELDPNCKLDGTQWVKGMSDRESLIIGLYEAIAKAEGMERSDTVEGK